MRPGPHLVTVLVASWDVSRKGVLFPLGVERTGGGGHSQQEHCQAPEVGEAGRERRVDSLRPLGNQGGDLSRAACV